MNLIFLAAATFASEDLACISAGALIANGSVNWFYGTLACFLGIFLGDIWLFLMGRWLGRPAIKRWPFKKLVSEESIERATAMFSRRGPSLVFASRFLPGSRLPVYFAAGLLRTRFLSFTGYFALACLLWTPLLVGASTLLHEHLATIFESLNTVTFLATAGTIYALIRAYRAVRTYRGRRLLYSAWRRWTRWEFWPMWLFYPPVVLYVLYLGIKHRSLTLFAAANPAIPGGGFAGESKSEILRALSGAGEFVARHFTVEESAGIAEVRRGMSERGWSYPVVVKPDRGERGAGVSVIRSDDELTRRMAGVHGRLIVQEYVAGYEFGVFYVRRPSAQRGFIFAITDKRFPAVTGDGARTVEELILSDDRAVCMAVLHFKNHAEDLNRVLQAGEKLVLVEMGTHCRGSLFLEGMQYSTPALENRIDEISQTFSGFYFGRYDIRTPSIEDFVQGRNFKIVELNGVTSEATSIYDPAYGVLHAYRVLMRQWKIAFEIGAANRKRGFEPPGLLSLLSMGRPHRRPAGRPVVGVGPALQQP